MTHRLEREQWIPGSLEDVFAFFSVAENLARITPAEMGFHILSPLPIEMRVDTIIEYRIRIAGVPLRWRSRISVWEPPHRFTDVQERGPYALWEHTHSFAPEGDGVRMRDVVEYRLPLGPLGRIVHALAVRRMLGGIFDHRARVIGEVFAKTLLVRPPGAD